MRVITQKVEGNKGKSFLRFFLNLIHEVVKVIIHRESITSRVNTIIVGSNNSVKVAQSRPTFYDPMPCIVHGIF